jgi:hypothetical protein
MPVPTSYEVSALAIELTSPLVEISGTYFILAR